MNAADSEGRDLSRARPIGEALCYNPSAKIEITPVVVIPDMSPLIRLAAAGRLTLFQEFLMGAVPVDDFLRAELTGKLGSFVENSVRDDYR